MKLNVKCPHCGAAFTDLHTFTPRSTWALVLLTWVFVIAVFAQILNPWPAQIRPDPAKDVEIAVTERRMEGQTLVVLGTLTNRGDSTWSSVKLEGSVLMPGDAGVAPFSGAVRASLPPGGVEWFKIRKAGMPATAGAPSARVELRLSSAHLDDRP